MILVAPKPSTEYRVAPDRVVRSDHRQMIYDVSLEDMMVLLDAHNCAPMAPDIVVHWFPSPVSVHCGRCGAFMERGEEDINVWAWLARGAIFDFLEEHGPHARYNYVEGWKKWPVTGPPVTSHDGPSGDRRGEGGWSVGADGTLNAGDTPGPREAGWSVLAPGMSD